MNTLCTWSSNPQQHQRAYKHKVLKSVKKKKPSVELRFRANILSARKLWLRNKTQSQMNFCSPQWGFLRLWKVNLDLIKMTGWVNLLSLPTLWVLSEAKITFRIMSELIVDFAFIRRGCEEDSAEQLVNVMYCLVCLLCRQCYAHRAGKRREIYLTAFLLTSYITRWGITGEHGDFCYICQFWDISFYTIAS